jgi:hypothetical protein
VSARDGRQSKKLNRPPLSRRSDPPNRGMAEVDRFVEVVKEIQKFFGQ